MRTHRRFQPALDSMPSRIAPSATGALVAVVQTGPIALDTDPPEGGGSSPIIIAPVTPPPTLPC